METQLILDMEKEALLSTYSRPDLVISHGHGVYLYDTDGKKYLDFTAGIAVNALGHCDPGAVQVLYDQAQKLWHCSNLFHSEPPIRLAGLLTESTFADRVFFSNSGSEAVEGAIKLARKWGHEVKGEECHEIIAMQNSFHGRSMGALSMTGQNKFWEGFNPMLPGIRFAEFNHLESVARLMNKEKICAIFVEPIQGEGGVQPATESFMKGLRKLANDNDCLLVLDEIQCGLGRTGKFCCYEWYDIEPDIMVIAKSLAGGLPLGAILVTQDVADHIKPGQHGSTFGGGPLTTAVSEYVVNRILTPAFLKHVAAMGEHLIKSVQLLQDDLPVIKDVRGKGLMVGIELSIPAKKVLDTCVEFGLLLCKSGDHVLRFLPPLIVDKKQIEEAVEILEDAIRECLVPTSQD
jgi:acetylornithine/N-succinyldiaminopimelate aminotransferase